MTLLALILAAAAASVSSAPSPTPSGWISGDTLTTILSILAGAGGVVGGKMWGDHKAKKQEDEIRTQIANELRTKVLNDPLHVEQSGYQAWWKDNAKDHEDIFKRLRNNESAIATLMERSISQGKTLDRMADQVGSLYDRIICRGGKKK